MHGRVSHWRPASRIPAGHDIRVEIFAVETDLHHDSAIEFIAQASRLVRGIQTKPLDTWQIHTAPVEDFSERIVVSVVFNHMAAGR